MNGTRLRTVRKLFNVDAYTFMIALGYECGRETAQSYLSAMENGNRPIPAHTQRLARMFELYGDIPEEMYEREM